MQTTDYAADLRAALLKGATYAPQIAAAARQLTLNADAVSEVKIEALRMALKADGFFASDISKYCGKGGLWAMGRANPDLVRNLMTGDGALAKVNSVQLIYKDLRAIIKKANAIESASTGDPIADAEVALAAERAAKAEAVSKSVARACKVLDGSQIAAAILDGATEHVAGVAQRMAYFDAIRVAMEDAIGKLLVQKARAEETAEAE